jgi:hypothetical protein
LQEFANIFEEIRGLPPKREIYFSIDLVPTVALVSKSPYRMSTIESKELQMQLEKLLKNGYICPSVSPWVFRRGMAISSLNNFQISLG